LAAVGAHEYKDADAHQGEHEMFPKKATAKDSPPAPPP